MADFTPSGIVLQDTLSNLLGGAPYGVDIRGQFVWATDLQRSYLINPDDGTISPGFAADPVEVNDYTGATVPVAFMTADYKGESVYRNGFLQATNLYTKGAGIITPTDKNGNPDASDDESWIIKP